MKVKKKLYKKNIPEKNGLHKRPVPAGIFLTHVFLLFMLGILASFTPAPVHAGQPISQIIPSHAASSAKPSGPVAVEYAWYQADAASLSGADLALVFFVTPADGSYIYGGASRGDAGKPTSLALGYAPGHIEGGEGFLREVHALFPPPAAKSDPWSGSQAFVYDHAIRILVPLTTDMLPKKTDNGTASLIAELSGLSCSDKNCTPFFLPLTVEVPASLADIPALNGEKWSAELDAYENERLAALRGAGQSDPSSITLGSGAVTLGSGTLTTGLAADTRHGVTLPDKAAPSPEGHIALQPSESPIIPELKPVYFVPELEVSSLGKAMLLGFFAGILLNFMPCVLPVLGLKLSALMAGTHGENEGIRRRLFIRHQLWFSAGIMVWFTVLGVVLAMANLAWGQLFQSQGLVLGLTLLLFLLALNLFGVFSLPILDLGAKSGSGSLQAFSNGFTATLLATPCSGPLLGGVLGWALLQPPFFMLISLWSVGLGMALPYLFMVLKPGLLTRLPKPGPWMRYMEGGLGFLLLAAAAYFATLLPPALLPRVLGSLVLAGMAAWLWGQVANPLASRRTRTTARLLAAALLMVAVYWPLAARVTGFHWQPYDEAAFAAQLGKQPVIVEFTADWCPTCKVMEATTLASAQMLSWQKRYGFTAIRVDLTRNSEQGQSLLRKLGSASIPLIALFPAGDAASSPLVLRDIVTRGQLEEALTSQF